MGRYIRSHSDSNTGSTVHKQIRITAGKYSRLFLRIIEVRNEIHSIFVNICQKLHGNFAQPCLRITHGCRTVSVHGTEVTMTIDKRISGRPFLCHIDQCTINGTVTMGMIFTHSITDDTGTLSVWLVRTIVQFNHRI